MSQESNTNLEQNQHEKMFEPKYVALLAIISLVFSTIFTLNKDRVDLNGEAIYFDIRDAILFQNSIGQNISSLLAVILAFVVAGICFYAGIKLIRIQKQRQNKSLLRRILIFSVFTNFISRLDEGIYMTWKTNLSAFWQVVGQAYVVLDVLIMVQYVSMASLIFLSSEFVKNSNKAKIVFYAGIIEFIVGIISLNLWALYPDQFAQGILVGGAMTLLMALLSILVVFNIYQIINRIEEHQQALKMIAFQLFAFILSIALLIWMSFTVEALEVGDYFMNVFLRNARLVLLLLASLAYFPAFITPALKEQKEI